MDPQRWKQIDELLDAVIELEPEKRSAFLDHVCAGDKILREKVEALLAADQDAGSFIQLPVLHPAVDYVAKPIEESSASEGSEPHPVYTILEGVKNKPSFHERQVIAGRYEIVSLLGAGGMGEVWHAYDVKLRVDVALKTLRFELASSGDLIEALRREVRNAREVISPNVCRIFDLVAEENQEFISMEYIDGVTLLRELQQNGPIELSEARDIAAQFLAGLDAIHRAGLVHCDLKPENIMITRTGRVVVMDFGIAKEVMQASAMISGTLPYMSPEQISGVAIDARADLYSAGVILAEMVHPSRIDKNKAREEIWNAVHKDPEQLKESPWKAVILRAVALDPDSRFASADALSRALEEATERVEIVEERKPYPGLSSFTTSDAEYFFGRELEVETIIKKLQQLHLMALIGPSGAGKTSLLRAGLIPTLPTDWSYLLCQPGDTPLLNLGQALAVHFPGDTEAMRRLGHLLDHDFALSMLGRWRQKHPEALLIVDRFEELFTLNPADVQSAFAGFIGRAVMESDVRVLLVMRDDFLIFCREHSILAPVFSELTAMLPLTGTALRRALVQPALKCGYRFEDEKLVDEIIGDVEKERGALPLMSFAAARLWEKRKRDAGLLTRDAYRAIGRVEGALAQHAEATMDRIGTERLPVVREIFRNLISPENTRAARDVEDLLSVFVNRKGAEEVLRMLIDARLLTSFEAPQTHGEMPIRRVEIIHESLISAWPRLVRWQTQDADGAQLRDQLRQAAQVWEQRSRSEDLLWTGTAFLEFQAWKQRYPGGLTSTEEAFSQAMKRHASKKQRQRRIAITATIVVLLGILAVISNLWHKSTVAKDNAISEAKRAEAGKTLVIGRSQADADTSTKLAYSIASLELADSAEGRRFALQALSVSPPALIMEVPVKPINSVRFSPDGKWIAAGTQGGLQLLPRDGSMPITVSEPYSSNLYIPWSSQFSSDGEFLIWTMRQDTRIVKVWSVSQQKLVRTFQMEGTTICLVRGPFAFLITDATGSHDAPFFWNETILRKWKFGGDEPEIVGRFNLGSVYWKGFDVDEAGRWIAYSKGKKPGVGIRALNESGIAAEKIIGSQAGTVSLVKFRPNHDQLVTAGGKIWLWPLDPAAKNPIQVIEKNSEWGNLWFDPTGSFLIASLDKDLIRWDLTSPPDADPLIFRFPEGPSHGVTFEKEGRWMAVAGNSTLAFFPLTHIYPCVLNGTGFNGAGNVRFTPDGKSIVAGFIDDGSNIRIWNMPGEIQGSPRTLWDPDRGNVTAIDVDPLGQSVIVGLDVRKAHLLSLNDGKAVPLMESPDSACPSVAFSRDGKYAAAAFTEFGIRIWDLKSQTSQVLERSKGTEFVNLLFSPDGDLFSGDEEGNLFQWNLKSGAAILLRKGKGEGLSGLAISPDGRLLASSIWIAAPDKSIQTSEFVIHDLKERKQIPILTHGNRVNAVAFDPSGTMLITGDADGAIRIGPINDEPQYLLLGHQNVNDIAVHPSGKWIASSDGVKPIVRLWAMPNSESLAFLPYKEFLVRLSQLTNVRVVPEKNSDSGYRIQYAPFPGWKKVPAW